MVSQCLLRLLSLRHSSQLFRLELRFPISSLLTDYLVLDTDYTVLFGLYYLFGTLHNFLRLSYDFRFLSLLAELLALDTI